MLKLPDEHYVTGRVITSMKSLLAEAVEMEGGQRAWSRKTGINQAKISQALSPNGCPTEAMMNALGYSVIPVCVPARKGMNR